MKVVQLVADNFKGLRSIEINPDGTPMVMLTGRNGQGKTSVLDVIWVALQGAAGMPKYRNSVIRNGADTMRIKLDLGKIKIERTMSRTSGVLKLKVTLEDGTEQTNPQKFLDDLLGELTFDPLAFSKMDPKEQVAMLRKVARIDIDFAAIDQANKADYEERTAIKRDIKMLEGQLTGMVEVPGLPDRRQDELPVITRMNNAAEANRKAQEISAAKQQLRFKMAQIEKDCENTHIAIGKIEEQIKIFERDLKEMSAELKTNQARHKAAKAEYEKAPEGKMVDIADLTAQLQRIQMTNSQIEERDRINKIRDDIGAKEKLARDLTLRREVREEKKRTAIASAQMPVAGMTFDENVGVLYQNKPIDTLSEGEKIRISTLIGMAANPEVKILCIRNGEALDEDGIKLLDSLAKGSEFQFWMSRVDTSGKIGIVLEDGLIVADNRPEEEKAVRATSEPAKKTRRARENA